MYQALKFGFKGPFALLVVLLMLHAHVFSFAYRHPFLSLVFFVVCLYEYQPRTLSQVSRLKHECLQLTLVELFVDSIQSIQKQKEGYVRRISCYLTLPFSMLAQCSTVRSCRSCKFTDSRHCTIIDAQVLWRLLDEQLKQGQAVSCCRRLMVSDQSGTSMEVSCSKENSKIMQTHAKAK